MASPSAQLTPIIYEQPRVLGYEGGYGCDPALCEGSPASP